MLSRYVLVHINMKSNRQWYTIDYSNYSSNKHYYHLRVRYL